MGTSNWQNLSYCIDLIREVNPNKILDVGVGFGRWGVVLREFLDVWNGNVSRSSWSKNIVGIEAFADNIDEYQKFFYNEILNVDAMQYILETDEEYDLIFFGDVLEHFTKADGIKILEKSLKLSKYVIINIPIGEQWEQGELYSNPYEEHKSVWTEDDFSNYEVIRKRFFKDYLCRDFVTVMLSNLDISESSLLYRHRIIKEIELRKIEIDLLNNYIEELNRVTCNVEEKVTSSYRKCGEYMKNKITIRVLENKNPLSGGSEVWIYNIGTEVVNIYDMEKINKDANWIYKNDGNSPTNKVLLASQPKSEINFNIDGDELNLKCLSHAWSGKIDILLFEKIITSVDLFSNNQKIVTIKINLKGN